MDICVESDSPCCVLCQSRLCNMYSCKKCHYLCQECYDIIQAKNVACAISMGFDMEQIHSFNCNSLFVCPICSFGESEMKEVPSLVDIDEVVNNIRSVEFENCDGGDLRQKINDYYEDYINKIREEQKSALKFLENREEEMKKRKTDKVYATNVILAGLDRIKGKYDQYMSSYEGSALIASDVNQAKFFSFDLSASPL